MVHTVHRYIDANPIHTQDRALILGTIHPHRTENFTLDFFYGNSESLWKLFREGYGFNLDSVEAVRQFLFRNHIWMSDMVRECDRSEETVTADSRLQNLVLNTEMIGNSLRNSAIKRIFFTSAFGTNNAAGLFCRAFRVDYKKTYNPITREFLIEARHFGREIIGVVLFSPSGHANRGIAQSLAYLSQAERYQESRHPILDFRLDFYRSKFGELVNEPTKE